VIGGSARKELQDHFRREKRLHACFELPLVGGFFRYCLKGALNFTESERSSSHSIASSSIIRGKANAIEDYNDGHGELAPGDIIYAMKSIHLSRVTDETFVEELRNEIAILKSLDHPHSK